MLSWIFRVWHDFVTHGGRLCDREGCKVHKSDVDRLEEISDELMDIISRGRGNENKLENHQAYDLEWKVQRRLDEIIVEVKESYDES